MGPIPEPKGRVERILLLWARALIRSQYKVSLGKFGLSGGFRGDCRDTFGGEKQHDGFDS